MAAVKPFPFPSFDEWYANKCQWKGRLGKFYGEIHPTCLGATTTGYGCAIATDSVPLNVYVRPVTRYGFRWDHENLDDLRAWYEEATAKANADWAKHVQENYLM